MTHYIPAFTELNGPKQRAACGAWSFRSEHSCSPECQGCQLWLEGEAAHDAEMEATFAATPDGPPVPADDFDVLAGYRPKGGAQ